MRSKLFDKPIRSIRRPSLAGDGLPERMRSTAVAFLGLTAAAGLALVAVFAQLGFPLLSPVPLPSAPEEAGSVSRAVPVTRDSAAAGLTRARGAVALPSARRGSGGPASAGREDRGAGVDRSPTPVSDPAAGDSPGGSEPVATPTPAATPDPAPAPAPVTTAEASPAPVEVPASSPETGSKSEKAEAKPAAGKPPKPEAKPAKTKPAKTKPVKPAKSEAKPAKEATPAPEASYVPVPAPAAAEKGKDKEEKDKKSK